MDWRSSIIIRAVIIGALFMMPLRGYCETTHDEEFLAWIKTQSPDKLAGYTADITAKQLPIQIDSMTLLYGVYAVSHVITMRVQVLASKEEFINMLNRNGKSLASYESEFKSMVTNMGCTQKTNIAYIKQGVDYRYLVTDNAYRKLFEVTIGDCP